MKSLYRRLFTPLLFPTSLHPSPLQMSSFFSQPRHIKLQVYMKYNAYPLSKHVGPTKAIKEQMGKNT